MSRAILISAVVAAAGCYSPNIKDGAFKCDADHGYVCPDGQTCDRTSLLCVKGSVADLGTFGPSVSFDFSTQPLERTCTERVRQGAFSGLTNLGAVNSAGDESSLALSADGKQLYFLDGAGAVETAALDAGGKSAPAPTAVTLNGLTGTVNGLAVAADGALWLSVTTNGTTALTATTRTSATEFTVGATHQPSAACPFSGIAFTDYDPKKQLFVGYPLAGCNQGPVMISQGLVDRNIGAFTSIVPKGGYVAPSAVPGHLLVTVSSAGANGRLYYAYRISDDQDDWSGPLPLPLGDLGDPSVSDVQAVVSPDCAHVYLVANRAGGKGGLDLWAADIAAE